MSAEPPAFPKALDDDDDDVAWALQTAGVQWERGGHADAVVWLRRAAEAAIEAGKFTRGADLQRGATAVESWVQRGMVGPAPDDDDDGVDALLADGPDIETSEMRGLSPSLVDMLEAEERGDFARSRPPQFNDTTDVGDLGDLEDVEDIEADDVVDLSEEVSFPPEPPTEAISSSRRPKFTVAAEDEAGRPPPSGTGVLPPLPSLPRRPLKPASRSTRPPDAALRSSAPPLRANAPSEIEDETAEILVELAPAAPAPEEAAPGSAPPASAPPASVKLRSEPPFEATLVDVGLPASPSDEPGAEEPLVEAAMMDVPFHEPTLVEARRPDDGSDAPASDGALPADTAPPAADAAPPADTAPPTLAGPDTTPAAEPKGVDVELLANCRGLEDLPPETQAELAARATVEKLAPEQEVSGFGLAIVAQGDVAVMPTIAEAACGYAKRGEPVFSRGNLPDGVSLRVVALADGAEVAVFRAEDFEHVLETCPWVADELRAVADRFQALAGVAMGPLGERLDDTMRAMVTERCEVRLLQAGDVLMEEGKPVAGLHVVGAGKLELVQAGVVKGELGPGDLCFAAAVLSREPAAATLRAAPGGALAVIADRMTTHELLVSVPPLLELLATS